MKKIYLILPALFLISSVIITAQQKPYQTVYGYDEMGNRTDFTVITLGTPPTAQKHTEAEPTVVTEELGEMEISVFPNPVKESLQLEITNMEKGNNSLKVLDLTGKVLIIQGNISESVTVDFSALPPGYYIMQLFIGDKRKEYKVVKE